MINIPFFSTPLVADRLAGSLFQLSDAPQPLELDQNVETIGGTFVDEERSFTPSKERERECTGVL